jgi:hypothetical protein
MVNIGKPIDTTEHYDPHQKVGANSKLGAAYDQAKRAAFEDASLVKPGETPKTAEGVRHAWNALAKHPGQLSEWAKHAAGPMAHKLEAMSNGMSPFGGSAPDPSKQANAKTALAALKGGWLLQGPAGGDDSLPAVHIRDGRTAPASEVRRLFQTAAAEGS